MLLEEVVLKQEGGEGCVVDGGHLLALQVFEAVDVRPVVEREDHPAKPVDQLAVGAFDQGGEPGDAVEAFHEDVVLGVGQHEVEFVAAQGELEFAKIHRPCHEAGACTAATTRGWPGRAAQAGGRRIS